MVQMESVHSEWIFWEVTTHHITTPNGELQTHEKFQFPELYLILVIHPIRRLKIR